MKNALRFLWKHIVYPPKSVREERLRAAFAGQWVVITGASSGIGEALAYRLMEAGANLYLIARSEEKLKALCERARAKGCKAEWYAIDLRRREELDAFCQRLGGRLPNVSYLFCNAGKSICRSIGSSLNRMHDFDRTMDLNYRAMVALTLALTPSLRRGEGGHEGAHGKRGRMIYTSSVSSLLPFVPGWSAYHASKCAANAWCRTARREQKSLGVKVQVAYMPLVHTPMSDINERYRRLPAYSADEGACILLNLAMSDGFCYKPWWMCWR